METQATDFKKIRQKKAAARIFRRMMAVLLIAALVVAGSAVLKNMEFVNMATWFSDMRSSFKGGPGFPVSSPGTALQMQIIGNDPVILTDTNLIIYNKSGSLLSSYQHGCRSPIIRTGGGRVLTFDHSGKQLRVDARTSNLYKNQFEGGIISANISQSGNIAVAEASDRYRAEIRVFDTAFKEIFAWYTSDYLVYDLSLSGDGKTMAVLCLSSAGGEILSQIVLFDLSADEPKAVIDVYGEVIMSAVFDSKNNLQVIADRSSRLYDANGREIDSFDYKGMHLISFDNNHKGQISLALDSFGDGNDLMIVNIFGEFSEIHKKSVAGPSLSLRNTNNNILLLTEHGLTVFSPDLSREKHIESGDAFLCVGNNEDIYTISPIEIIKEELPIFTEE